ncbi:MAG: ATP-binding protein [Ferruginibacter sp.]
MDKQLTKMPKLPFLFIAGLSIGLILIILFTTNLADKSISQLKLSSQEAVRVFKGNQLLDGVINNIFIAENALQNKDSSFAIADTVYRLAEQNTALRKLFQKTEVEAATNDFTALVDEQVQHFKSKKPVDTVAKNQRSADIFVAAIGLEEKYGQYLEKNISGNEKLAARVLRLDVLLTIFIILTIATLATIIIAYLLRNIRLIKAIQQQRTEIEKAASIKEQFLANMSHEIRTPINSVIGFTNLLQKTELDMQQEAFVNIIRTAGDNLLSIVNDILDISKIEAGMLHFHKSSFSIMETCYQVETMLYQRANEKDLEIHTIVDTSVPEIVIGDKERLLQVLINLTTNAIKFTDKGHISINVKATALSDTSVTIRFGVRDTGIGIPTDKLSSIFQRFEQAEADTTRKYGGTGLGLSIVKNLVEMQGGSMSVTSEPGKGSEFYFTITYEIGNEFAGDMHAEYQKNSLPASAANSSSLKTLKVLAAEDNKMNQLLLTMLLEQWKINVDIVENGELVLEKLATGDYDLVLMDIQMPLMDGYTAVKKIRSELKSNIPVVAMTANVLPGEKEKCLEAGMNGYISKPINEPELYSLMVFHSNNAGKLEQTETLTAEEPNKYVSEKYLYKIFNGNSEHVAEILGQLIIQYKSEVERLGKQIETADLTGARRTIHSMKTTVSSVKRSSPLLQHLLAMENTSGDESGWNIIRYNYDILVKTMNELINEAKQIINK